MSRCLNPVTIKNPRFNPHKKRGFLDEDCTDEERDAQRAIDANYPYIPEIQVPCGLCIGCLRDKSNSWRVRLLHEQMYGKHTSTTCLTLTINDDYINEFKDRTTIARHFRAFFDRLRYYTPKRCIPKHFFISELGEERGRLHFHGFIWDVSLPHAQYGPIWKYGFIKASDLRSYKQLSYCAKYVTKPTIRWHKPMLFVSPGLGIGYLEDTRWQQWHHQGNDDNPINSVIKFERFVYAMPSYYRKKIFDDCELGSSQKSFLRTNRPFKKILGRTTYTDRRSYQEAREEVLATSIRSGKSKLRKKKPPIYSDLSALDFDTVFNQFINDHGNISQGKEESAQDGAS